MLKNYLKTAWRNLLRNKLCSLINITGLTLSLASVLFILIWIQNEMSYDRYNVHSDRIYRVSREFLNVNGSTNIHLATISLPFAPLFARDFPEVDKVTRFLQDHNMLRYGEKKFDESHIIVADSNFFKVFTLGFIQGNPSTALSTPNTVVISRDIARKYFNDSDPLNKTIYYGEERLPLKITGIVDNMPENSHFKADIFISFITLRQFIPAEDYTNDWGGNNYFTYLLLRKNTDPEILASKFPAFLDKYLPAYDGLSGSRTNRLHLQKITRIHLYSHLMSEAGPNGDVKYLYIFGCIAFFILLIACINYMNLTTALALSRLKEVGVRKVIGAERRQLFFQFFTESAVVTFLALLLALGCVFVSLPLFQKFNGTIYSFSGKELLLLGAGVFVLLSGTAILAGIYPSVYISGFKPIAILKGRFRLPGFNFSLRKALVVFQFAVSVILIISVLVISRQLNYMQNADLGFNKDWVMVLPVNDSISNNLQAVKSSLLSDPDIISSTFSSRIPSGQLLDMQDGSLEVNGAMKSLDFRLSYITTDFGYLNTFKMKMAAGRNFSTDYPTDSLQAFIVNESAVQAAGWKSDEDAINKNVEYGGRRGRIIGVVRDFNFESLEKPITPIIFYISSDSRRVFSVRLSGNHLQSSINHVKEVWRQFAPEMEFSYSFLDERLYDLYQSQRKQRAIYLFFGGIAVFIASLGLFGLAAFATERRLKEIGIRKVLGAGVAGIIALLSGDFLKLVIVSIMISCPLAWLIMNKWLQDFAYRINISAWIFIIAGALAILIALITISYQAIKAAVSNPVNSLRTE